MARCDGADVETEADEAVVDGRREALHYYCHALPSLPRVAQYLIRAGVLHKSGEPSSYAPFSHSPILPFSHILPFSKPE